MVIDHEEGGAVASVDVSTIVTLHDRDFDRQIATARRFPRSTARAREEIAAFATETEETAQECIYALKRKDADGGSNVIIGPSARFAEIVATSWGNARYATRIIDEAEQFITAQAVFHDLERNSYISLEVMRRIVGRNGNRYGVDMIGVTAQAAMSIAMRNAILKGVPRSVWGDGYSKAYALISGGFESIDKRRKAAIEAFTKLGVEQEQVLKLLEREKLGEITPEDIVVLRGTLSAVRDGDTSLDRIFGARRREAGKADLGKNLKEGRERDDQRRQGQGEKDGAAESKPSKNAGKPAADEPGKSEAADSEAGGNAADESEAGDGGAGGDAGGGEADLGAGGGRREPEKDAATVVIGDLSHSPLLSDAAAEHLEADHGETFGPLLIDLVNRLSAAKALAELNKIWDALAMKFDAAPAEVDAAHAALRAARNKDIRNAAKSATAKL